VRIKVDEDLPRAAGSLLREAGFGDTKSVVEQGMGGWSDSSVWQAVQDEGRFFITADKGFGDIRVYPPGEHAGVLLLRPDADGIQPVLDLLRGTLDAADLSSLKGTLSVATSKGLRSRRL
jgi:predicted nuclease of predicted toxin-antitoxin system